MTTIYLCEHHNMATVVGPASADSCERCELVKLRAVAAAADELEQVCECYGNTDERKAVRDALAAWRGSPDGGDPHG